jgi:hypothetical protein
MEPLKKHGDPLEDEIEPQTIRGADGLCYCGMTAKRGPTSGSSRPVMLYNFCKVGARVVADEGPPSPPEIDTNRRAGPRHPAG